MNLLTYYIIAALATYRVSRMVATEDGPLNIFLRLRTRVREFTRGRGDSSLYRGVNCPACISVWLSWPVAALLPWIDWQTYVLTALALSGAATWLYKQERP